MAKEKRTAIIGAGLGGLSAAIHLANAGYSVDVFEKNAFPGGKAGCLNDSGFRFDTGPSLLTMPFVLEEIFSSSKENIKDYLHIEPLDVICRYFYSDKTIIKAYRDREKFAEELNIRTGESADSIFRYLDYCKSIYELTADLFIFSNFQSITNFINKKALKAILNLKKIDPFRSMDSSIRSYFNDSRVVQLFNRYATYNGSNPYTAPATLNIIPHVEYNLGGFVVKEGMYAVPKALEKIAAKKGVRFFYNSNVENIETEGLNVYSISTGGKKHHYPIIISNADVNYTYKTLLNSRELINDEESYSSSAIIFYWGVKGIHTQLDIHNILFSKDYRKEFDDIFSLGKIPDDPTVYIYISAKFNERDALKGYENWFVMINTPPLKHNNESLQIKIDLLRWRIIEKIKTYTGVNLNNKIVYEKYAGPAEIEKMTNSTGGSIYGISSNSRSSAFLRHKNNSKIKGLYFAGGTVHPGGGIPLVLLSGKLAAESVIKDSL